MTARRAPKKRSVALITGSRAEFGLLLPVIRAIQAHPRLRLHVIAAGAHFLPPARTISEVRRTVPVAAEVRMQRPNTPASRPADAAAVARGIAGFTRAFEMLDPDWVLVLGDRIEAFAAASGAAIGGWAVAHIHGGDRAEGIADESMRHAITKLAHLHLPATRQSADRIIRMGERPEHVRLAGSPAIDGLRSIKPMPPRQARALGDPRAIVLLHPSGLDARTEHHIAAATARAILSTMSGPILALSPNQDPGREAIAAAFATAQTNWTFRDHLPRAEFLSLLKRLATTTPRGILIGNSSAGLIEAAALQLPVVNIGPRQDGRERAGNVIDVPLRRASNLSAAISRAIARAMSAPRLRASHPYGDGRASARIAAALADPTIDPRSRGILRKRNAY